jgi:fatty acid desaturase
MRFVLPPMRRPRHPLARFLSLVLGLALIGVLLVFGLFVAGVLLVGSALVLIARQWNHRHAVPRAAQQPQTLEGEYVVIRQGRPTH